MGLSICTVQRGNDITLYVELIDTQKDTVLWKDGYNRSMTNLVALQSEIAKDVSTKLKTKLTGSEEARVTKTSTTNPEAYQHYLKGRYYWNRRTAENIRKAIEQFKGAIDNDPNYALAYAGLADCYAVLSEYAGTPISETALQAKSFAERAIAIDGQLAEPHASLGWVNRAMWQWAAAEKEFKRAIDLNPNYATAYHWYSLHLKDLGKFDDASGVDQAGARKEAVGRYIAAVYAGLGEKDKAFEWLEKDFQTRNGELGSIRWSIPVSIPKAKQEKAFAEPEKAFEERDW